MYIDEDFYLMIPKLYPAQGLLSTPIYATKTHYAFCCGSTKTYAIRAVIPDHFPGITTYKEVKSPRHMKDYLKRLQAEQEITIKLIRKKVPNATLLADGQ